MSSPDGGCLARTRSLGAGASLNSLDGFFWDGRRRSAGSPGIVRSGNGTASCSGGFSGAAGRVGGPDGRVGVVRGTGVPEPNGLSSSANGSSSGIPGCCPSWAATFCPHRLAQSPVQTTPQAIQKVRARMNRLTRGSMATVSTETTSQRMDCFWNALGIECITEIMTAKIYNDPRFTLPP